MIVQDVEKVELANAPLEKINSKIAIENLVGGPVEACSDYLDFAMPQGDKWCKAQTLPHPFVDAINEAYAYHRPISFSPDMFWLLIAQGLATYVDNNAEKLREKFVSHEGQETIQVRRDDFIKGSPENLWGEVFGTFSEKIKEYIGDENHSQIVCNFSTTGPIEQAANEIVLMGAMKNYFHYEVMTCCGIPQVTLEGEVEDWVKLFERTEVMGRAYGLEDWTGLMLPIIERIANNAAGEDDAELWQEIYKLSGGSGSPTISGWILNFFPYLKDRNSEVTRKSPIFDKKYGSGMSSLPSSLCKVPFNWLYYGDKIPMEFISGFIGVTQNEDTLEVRPKIGWAVREEA